MESFNIDKEHKIKSGFKIPEDYFDRFSDKLMEQLPERETKVISLWKNKWLYAVAAVLVLSLSIPFIYNYQNESAAATNAAIENYLSYHANLTDEDIVELLDKEDLDQINVTNTVDDAVMEDVLSENANLEQYMTN